MGAFGSACKSIVNEYGITYRAVANAANYDVSYVSKWINSGIIPASSAAKEVCIAIAKAAVDSSGESDEGKRLEAVRTLSTRLYNAYRADERENDFHQSSGARQPRSIEADTSKSRTEMIFDALRRLRADRSECKLTIFADLPSLDEGEIVFLIDVLNYVRELDFESGAIYLVLTENGIDRLDDGVKTIALLNLFMIRSHVDLFCYRGLVSEIGLAILGDTFVYSAQCWGHNRWLFESFDLDHDNAMRRVSLLSRDLMPTARKLFFDAPDEEQQGEGLTEGGYWHVHDHLLLGMMSCAFCERHQLERLLATANPALVNRCLALTDDLSAMLEAGKEVRCILYRQACDDFVYDGKLMAGGITLTLSPAQRLEFLSNLIDLLGRYPNLQVRVTDGYVVKEVKHRFLPIASFCSRSCMFVTFPIEGVSTCRVVKDRGTRKAIERGFDRIWNGDEVLLHELRDIISEYFEDCEALII
jgi:hypothetical protein